MTMDDTETIGNSKEAIVFRARRIVMTFNNYSEGEYYDLVELCKKQNWWYVIGKEIGTNGTPHLQCYIEHKKSGNCIRWDTVTKAVGDGIHNEKAKGSKAQNLAYCSKDGDFVTNIEILKKLNDKILEQQYVGVVWRDWQLRIIESLQELPDDRTINWYWEPNGKVGKSYLCKYLKLTGNVLFCDGSEKDVFHELAKWMDAHPEQWPDTVLVDTCRDNFRYLHYSTLEKLKNGLMHSGKYEGACLLTGWMHVVCFANEEPDYDKMSKDRWNVVRVG